MSTQDPDRRSRLLERLRAVEIEISLKEDAYLDIPPTRSHSDERESIAEEISILKSRSCI